MKHLLITGVSGYIGRTLAMALADDPSVERIVGIDVRPPGLKFEKLHYYKHDVRQPLADVMRQHAVDTVVHAAYILPPIHNTALMESINVEGTRNVLRSSQAAGVGHLLYTSSTTAYGFHPDNPDLMPESQPLRGNEDFTYAKNKREIEALVRDFSAEFPEIAVTVLRPCFVVGPNMNNPLSNHLKKCIVMLPKENAPLQFVHEKDLIRAILDCLRNRVCGTYNIAGQGTVSAAEMVRLMGNTALLLPYRWLCMLNHIAWTLRLHFLTEFPSAALKIFRYPWVASPRLFIEKTGFAYEYDSHSAFADFAAHWRAVNAGGERKR